MHLRGKIPCILSTIFTFYLAIIRRNNSYLCIASICITIGEFHMHITLAFRVLMISFGLKLFVLLSMPLWHEEFGRRKWSKDLMLRWQAETFKGAKKSWKLVEASFIKERLRERGTAKEEGRRPPKGVIYHWQMFCYFHYFHFVFVLRIANAISQFLVVWGKTFLKIASSGSIITATNYFWIHYFYFIWIFFFKTPNQHKITSADDGKNMHTWKVIQFFETRSKNSRKYFIAKKILWDKSIHYRVMVEFECPLK